jgi:hypothetical protein
MKRNKFLYVLVAGLVALSSCDLNTLPEFDDKDAFVAFDNVSLNVPEEGGEVRIPVTLSSLAGLAGTATFEVDDAASTAKAGESYAIKNGSNTLTFTKEAPTQYIELSLIDNDIFTGDLVVTFKLTGASINIGANASVRVNIADNEHPLLMILGTYTGTVGSYRGDFAYDIIIEKDPDDLSKVWVSNLEPYFASAGYVGPDANYVYGIVNEEKTEIRIPTGQDIGYQDVTIEGLDGPNWEEADFLPSGGFMIIEIQDGGAKLHIPNAFGAFNAAGNFYNIVFGGAVYSKN